MEGSSRTYKGNGCGGGEAEKVWLSMYLSDCMDLKRRPSLNLKAGSVTFETASSALLAAARGAWGLER